VTYVGDTGKINATYRPIGEVETLHRPTVDNAFVATGSVTNGQFGLFQYSMGPRAGGPEAHFHKTFSESFYIVEGTVRLFNGEKWVDARAGDFLYVAEGGIHAFRNESDERAQMLILFAPAPPRENYFRELAELLDSGRQLSPEEYTEFLARHDPYMV
jgi:mannose-6-phosphate isomerase-like protein (cupin superfamily)